MAHANVVKAYRPGQSPRRRAKTYGASRTCADRECTTRISRYNPADRCFRHAPAVFPRLRGIVTDS